ncbi:MAG: formylglycine-generating enzyme family protein [bacterium]|nr:formylglycine-generating enzyme family protein [bacterium]
MKGAQKHDPRGPNYDPIALTDESPVHEVRLSALFLSKYEMTQAQWERFMGRNPSHYRPDVRLSLGTTLENPVESLSWHECVQALEWMGLALPSKAQWEYGCRGGTTTPFACPEIELEHYTNLGEQAYANKFRETIVPETWNDGFAAHAAVGSFRPNPFGLHDVHGNVREWCADGYSEGDMYLSTVQEDPLRPPKARPTAFAAAEATTAKGRWSGPPCATRIRRRSR